MNTAGKTTTPSWVAYGEDNKEIIVGEAAGNRDNYYYEVKRVIG